MLPPAPRLKTARFWFALGREPLISAAELLSLLPPTAAVYPDFASGLLFSYEPVKPEEMMARLGGTIKIAETVRWEVSEKELLECLTENLRQQPGKIIFGLSLYGPGAPTEQLRTIKRLGFEIKKILETAGRSARLIIKDEPTLSSATVTAQKLTTRGAEYLIYQSGGKFSAARTVAVQPFAEWSERDYGRPGRDDLSGMLPPKLARMLVNLAGLPLDEALLDPFCGSGTILTEAALLGHKNLIGSDISDKAIADTKQNITWTQSRLPARHADASHAGGPATSYQLQANVFQADVRDLAKKISAHSVAGIVTEPYLGPPLKGAEKPAEIQANCAELAELYAAGFQNFTRVLAPRGVVVVIIPQFILRNKTYRVAETLVPKIKKLGFVPQPLLLMELHAEPYLVYRRPGQRVGREIWKFRFTA